MNLMASLRKLVGIESRPPLPASFSTSTRFFFYPLSREKCFFIFSTELGWCRMDKGFPDFVRETPPSWAPNYTVELDEPTFRDLFRNYGKYWSDSEKGDRLASRRSVMEERQEIPPIPTSFPEDAQFWLKEWTPYLYLPDEGWFVVTRGRMCFRGEREPAEISRAIRVDEATLREHIRRS
jgi:hypothetical protein